MLRVVSIISPQPRCPSHLDTAKTMKQHRNRECHLSNNNQCLFSSVRWLIDLFLIYTEKKAQTTSKIAICRQNVNVIYCIVVFDNISLSWSAVHSKLLLRKTFTSWMPSWASLSMRIIVNYSNAKRKYILTIRDIVRQAVPQFVGQSRRIRKT